MEIKIQSNIAGNTFQVSADDRGEDINEIFIKLAPFLKANIPNRCNVCRNEDERMFRFEINKAQNGGYIYTKVRCSKCEAYSKLNQAKETKVFFWDIFKPKDQEFEGSNKKK